MKNYINPFLTYQFLVFVIVAIGNTLFGYLVFAFFLFLGFHYSAAVLLGTIICLLINFKSIGIIVFKKSNNRLIFRFIVFYIFLYFINILLIKWLYLFIPNFYIDGAITAFPLTILSFYLNKRFVFH